MQKRIRLFFPFIILLILSAIQVSATGLKTLCRLPEKVEETSGIELTGKNEVWTLNDSGGTAELYLCNTIGNLIRTVVIDGANNQDWEDLAQDDLGNFYIGDMGNNNNDRENLCIYKIPNPDATNNSSVQAEKIKFSYEDQTAFPPDDNNLNFDCEAIIWYKNNLYLFSKNRSLPIKTSVYRIPDEPGEYVAEKLGTFDTGGTSTAGTDIYSYWITAADISPNGKELALLSHDRVWVFYNFAGDNFFNGDYKIFQLETNTQKEAICFADDSTLYITDEYWSTFDLGRNLYKMTISPAINTGATNQSTGQERKVTITPNPFTTKLKISSKQLTDYQLQLTDQQGKLYRTLIPSASTLTLNLGNLPNGLYLLWLYSKKDDYCQVEKLVKE